MKLRDCGLSSLLVVAVAVTLTMSARKVTAQTSMGDTLPQYASLGMNEALVSANGQYVLVLQGDNNLVEYDRGFGYNAIWASNTQGSAGVRLVLQGDGNLVLYRPNGHAVWASNTVGAANPRLVLQNDGNVVLYRGDGRAVWASDTAVDERVKRLRHAHVSWHWWGASLELTTAETATLRRAYASMLNSGAPGALGGGIATALGATAWPVAIASTLVQAEAMLLGAAVDTAASHSSIGAVSLNFSWVPIGWATVVSYLWWGSGPEISNALFWAEEVTLINDTRTPGWGSPWYSVFWVSAR